MFTQQSTRKARRSMGSNKNNLLASGARFTYEDEPYPTRLNFYMNAPLLEISIEEFEQFALDRMQVLTALQTAMTRNLPQAQLEKAVNDAILKYMPMGSERIVPLQELMKERRKDHVSHYILRLAYSRSQELRSWFLRAECALFRYRFEKESQKDQLDFLEKQNLSWKKVSEEDKRTYREELQNSAFKPKNIEDETYFEVDFERVTGLVGRRQVFVKDGKAFVPLADQVVLVLDEFRERLGAALEATGRALPRMDEDDRLMPLLNNINKQYLGREFTTSAIAGEIQAQDVDALKVHMPLCMEHLHDELRKDKHTRHGGRMQYGLFLKGMGLSLEQALIFWQHAFGNLTPEQFNKQYAYNVRHSYGMEGKRTDYTPYSCKSIIMGQAPGAGDHHGCPFRHFDAQRLKAKLVAHQLDDMDQNDIIGLVNGKHYQIACTRYYEVTRARLTGRTAAVAKNGASGGVVASQELIEHPNQFFEQSYELLGGGGGGPTKNKATPGTGQEINSTHHQGADMELEISNTSSLSSLEDPSFVGNSGPTVRGGYSYKKASSSGYGTNNNERYGDDDMDF